MTPNPSMLIPHSHRERSRLNWPLVAVNGGLSAALLLAGVVLWYAFAIALPNSQRDETNRRIKDTQLDVLTKHMLRVETSLHLR